VYGVRVQPYEYGDLMAHDYVNLDIAWLPEPASAGLNDGVPPEIIAQEIDDLTAALAEFSAVADALAARAAARTVIPPEH
jgi:type I restriction enzyme M protein